MHLMHLSIGEIRNTGSLKVNETIQDDPPEHVPSWKRSPDCGQETTCCFTKCATVALLLFSLAWCTNMSQDDSLLTLDKDATALVAGAYLKFED
jgi:hypothetical protein